MVYYGKGALKRLGCGWEKFALENKLVEGDACVFELMDSKDVLQFKVQILKGDLPFDGKTAATPILVE